MSELIIQVIQQATNEIDWVNASEKKKQGKGKNYVGSQKSIRAV